jgi:hypothetical protein
MDTVVPAWMQLWRMIKLVDVPTLLIGGLAAATGHRWGGFVLVANLVVQIGAHLAAGSWAYRDVMSRPWPQVGPATDDEWDD